MFSAHQIGELFIDNLYDLLTRGQTFHDLFAHSSLFNPADKILYHLIIDIGFQQRHLDFPQCCFDISFGKLAFALEFFKGILKFFSQSFKNHGLTSSAPCYRQAEIFSTACSNSWRSASVRGLSSWRRLRRISACSCRPR